MGEPNAKTYAVKLLNPYIKTFITDKGTGL
jgi:hypothetical protein